MALLGKLFWIALFCVFTFGFVVLFDHGPENYVENAKKDFNSLRHTWDKKLEKKKDDSDAGAR